MWSAIISTARTRSSRRPCSSSESFRACSSSSLGSFQHFSGTLPDYSGIGDIGAALKWRMLEHAPVLGDFALQPSLKIPTGSEVHGTGTGTTDVGLLLISSHDWGGYALDLNCGYTRRSGDGSRAPKDATLWTVSGGGPVYRTLGWVAEFYRLSADHRARG